MLPNPGSAQRVSAPLAWRQQWTTRMSLRWQPGLLLSCPQNRRLALRRAVSLHPWRVSNQLGGQSWVESIFQVGGGAFAGLRSPWGQTTYRIRYPDVSSPPAWAERADTDDRTP